MHKFAFILVASLLTACSSTTNTDFGGQVMTTVQRSAENATNNIISSTMNNISYSIQSSINGLFR